ncbi:MAG: hypothetical protein QXQ37_00630 [Nitrososphaerota archaeon]
MILDLRRELGRIEETKKKIQAQIKNLENNFEMESMMVKIRLENDLKILDEVEKI